AIAEQTQAIETSLQPDWNPSQNPLETVNSEQFEYTDPLITDYGLLNTAVITTTDSDNDGLSDLDEADWHTCAYSGAPQNCTNIADSTDSDGDGLSDGVEVIQLGIVPTRADTDGDSITDTLEVQGFDYAGITWYLNPASDDTNRDGLPDGLECPALSIISGEFDPNGVCPDTDNDGVPDPFDDDNDGDGVDDAVDLSPQVVSGDTFNNANPFQLTVNNLEMNRPVFVDFQLKPLDAEHLSYYTRILDWPDQDFDGQIQRVQDTTFATSDNPDIVSTDGNAANGDIRLVPMLELSMPYSAGHYANLPITTTAPSTRILGDPVTNWLDTTELDPYGITVRDVDAATGNLTTYVPLSLVTNANGSGLQAFAARMLYYPQQGSGGVADWGSAQEARLVWLVQMITDQCDDPQADPQTCARTDTLDVIHIYEESWTLTG
ncbi:MAG: hypothetical protein GY803_17940, partial [Chloroflexi bacterium]|nr:hypothetical protein [Chloroflexota bacterium]